MSFGRLGGEGFSVKPMQSLMPLTTPWCSLQDNVCIALLATRPEQLTTPSCSLLLAGATRRGGENNKAGSSKVLRCSVVQYLASQCLGNLSLRRCVELLGTTLPLTDRIGAMRRRGLLLRA